VATPDIRPVWTGGASPSGDPVFRFHIRTAWSWRPATAMGAPSGSNRVETAETGSVVSKRPAERGSGSEVPGPHGLVLAADDGNGVPSGKQQGGHRARPMWLTSGRASARCPDPTPAQCPASTGRRNTDLFCRAPGDGDCGAAGQQQGGHRLRHAGVAGDELPSRLRVVSPTPAPCRRRCR
jgi:hypothetical protein